MRFNEIKPFRGIAEELSKQAAEEAVVKDAAKETEAAQLAAWLKRDANTYDEAARQRERLEAQNLPVQRKLVNVILEDASLTVHLLTELNAHTDTYINLTEPPGSQRSLFRPRKPGALRQSLPGWILSDKEKAGVVTSGFDREEREYVRKTVSHSIKTLGVDGMLYAGTFGETRTPVNGGSHRGEVWARFGDPEPPVYHRLIDDEIVPLFGIHEDGTFNETTIQVWRDLFAARISNPGETPKAVQ